MRIAPLLLACICSFTASCNGDTTAHPGEPKVREFLNTYFSTWSAADMEGYGDCFHPLARIMFVAPDGATRSDGLTDFLHGQKIGHARSREPMTEVPTSMNIIMEDRGAQALVRWKLTKGEEIVTGTDLFTLVSTPKGWKILSLVFYND
jgi:hypothetical protein